MNEKRRYARIERILPLKLSDPEFDIVTETKNISGNGAYCAVSRSLPLMTKLKITVLIPKMKGKNKTIKKINCKGVVVREENIKNNGKYPHCIGVYFNEISEKNRKVLLDYINSFRHGRQK